MCRIQYLGKHQKSNDCVKQGVRRRLDDIVEKMACLACHDDHQDISPEHAFAYGAPDDQEQNTNGSYQRYYVPHFDRHGIPPCLRMSPHLLILLYFIYFRWNPATNRVASYRFLERTLP